MKNRMLPESELRILGELFEKVDKLVENHESTSLTPEKVANASDIEQIHIVMYMDLLKDLILATRTIKDLLEIGEEEFIEAMTDKGKRSLTEVKRVMMMKMITDMIG